jgi:glycosyltransferase involved in cell wall biosynthesis
MKILMLLDNQFPPDIRVENEAISLSEKGHEVFLLSYQFDKSIKIIEEYKNFTILRFPVSKFKAKKFRALVTILPLLKKLWVKQLNKLYKELQFDVLHAHDLYMAEPALEFAKNKQVKIVLDLHETWVNALKELEFTKKIPLKFFIDYDKWEAYEKEWIEKANKVIVVAENVRYYYKEKYNISIDKFHNVPNYLNFKTFPIPDKLDFPGNSILKLVYGGGLDYQRGLDIIIRALKNVTSKNKNIHLTIAGTGNALEPLKKLTNNLGLNQFVTFLGQVPPSKISEVMNNAHVGIIPHRKSPHTDNGIPHKLFQYMILGKPILASDIITIKNIVESTQCGLIFKSESIEDATEKIFDLIKNFSQLEMWGQRGREAVLNKYNWKNSEKELLKLYSSL